jgi:hypothetical protein
MSGLIAGITLAGALAGGVVEVGTSPMPAEGQSSTSSQPLPGDPCQSDPNSPECWADRAKDLPVGPDDAVDGVGKAKDWWEERKPVPNADDALRTGADDVARTGGDDVARTAAKLAAGGAALGGAIFGVQRHRKAHKQGS